MHRANTLDPSKWEAKEAREAEECAEDTGHVNLLAIDRLWIKVLIHIVDRAGWTQHDFQPGSQRPDICQGGQDTHLLRKNITIGELLHRVDILGIDGWELRTQRFPGLVLLFVPSFLRFVLA